LENESKGPVTEDIQQSGKQTQSDSDANTEGLPIATQFAHREAAAAPIAAEGAREIKNEPITAQQISATGREPIADEFLQTPNQADDLADDQSLRRWAQVTSRLEDNDLPLSDSEAAPASRGVESSGYTPSASEAVIQEPVKGPVREFTTHPDDARNTDAVIETRENGTAPFVAPVPLKSTAPEENGLVEETPKDNVTKTSPSPNHTASPALGKAKDIFANQTPTKIDENTNGSAELDETPLETPSFSDLHGGLPSPVAEVVTQANMNAHVVGAGAVPTEDPIDLLPRVSTPVPEVVVQAGSVPAHAISAT